MIIGNSIHLHIDSFVEDYGDIRNMSSMTLCEAACLYRISESFKFV